MLYAAQQVLLYAGLVFVLQIVFTLTDMHPISHLLLS